MEGAFCATRNQSGIGYYGGTGRKYIGIKKEWNMRGYRYGGSDFGTAWIGEQVITITLDLTGEQFGILSMTKGDEDLGILDDKVDIKEEYCLAVAFMNKYTVQLCYK